MKGYSTLRCKLGSPYSWKLPSGLWAYVGLGVSSGLGFTAVHGLFIVVRGLGGRVKNFGF